MAGNTFYHFLLLAHHLVEASTGICFTTVVCFARPYRLYEPFEKIYKDETPHPHRNIALWSSHTHYIHFGSWISFASLFTFS